MMALERTMLPRPDLALVDAGIPLVCGTSALLKAVSFAQSQDYLTAEQVSEALALLAGRLDEVRDILRRFESYQEL